MFNNRIIKSITGSFGIWLILVLVFGALLVVLSSPTTLAHSVTDGFNLRRDNAILTNGEPEDKLIYLPVVMKNFPYTPDAPLLDAISNVDGDGNYTVSWSSSEGADTYTLQEDDSAGFSSPTTVYSGSSTSKAVSGRDVGTYYYRVKASNAFAGSGWSNIEAVEVTVPLPVCPQTGPWPGNTSQGEDRDISFVVEDSPQCQIALDTLRIELKDSCGSVRSIKLNGSPLITNNHFSFSGDTTTVIGDFSSPNTASGTFSYNEGGCTASGTWTADVNLGADSTVYALAVQPDGKIVVGGSFNWLRGQKRAGIGRLNPDGTLDDTFNPGADGSVYALAVQADGKILVGGSFNKLGGETYNYIGRLNPDGSLDAGFNPGNYFTGIGWGVKALVVQTDGKIVVGGKFRRWEGYPAENMARLNPDGSTDTAYNPRMGGSVNTLALQDDGKILVGMVAWLDSYLKQHCPIPRKNPDGSTDYTFLVSVEGLTGNTRVQTLLVQPDGKILVGGYFLEMEGVARRNIGRLYPDGTLDDTFNPGASSAVNPLALQADGKILVGGNFTTLGGESRRGIGRLNSDGSPDMDFNPGADHSVYVLAVQADGKILVGGSFTTLDGQTRNRIGRLDPDGTLDETFP